MTEKLQQTEPRKRGTRDVVMAIAAAALILLPSYLDFELINRFKIAVSTLAIPSIAMFLIGVFLLIRVLRE